MSRTTVGFVLFCCLLSFTALGDLSYPPSIDVEATSPSGAIVTFTVSVVGDSEGDEGRGATVTCTPPSGSLFPIGTTTVACSGSEGSSASFPVTVSDHTPPSLSLPFSFTVVTTNPSGETVTYTAVATDLVDGPVPISCSPASGSTFPVGTTTVTCTASDSLGNTASGSFNITVSETAPPEGNPDIVAEATGPDGAHVTFETSDSEEDDGRPGSGGCSPAPGSLFPLGNTTVICPSGNFVVSVVDTTGPALSLPSTINEVATSPAGADVTYTATADDLVDGSVAVTCTPPSGSTFAIGTTTVNCSASDAAGNSSTGSFLVVVTEEPEPPTNPNDITAEATGPGGAVVTFSLGNDEGGRPITCSPGSGETFPLGDTSVSCSDGSSFTVSIVDTTAPTLSLPANITAEATGPAGAAVTFSATATDIVDGSVAVVCTPSSGSTFALGTTTVNCSATDAHSNTASGSFSVTVEDTTPPDLTLPANITAEATSAAGAVVTFSATATDIVDGSVAVVCTPPSGSTFALGTTTVNCSATDAHSNTASGSFSVTVVDTTPPEIISVTVNPASIWPPNKKMVGVTVTVVAEDAVDPAPLVQIFAITCDETIGAGDAVITGPLTANLKADRDGNGDGRVYTLHIEVIDASGNRSVATVDVVVPHDQSGNSTISEPTKRRSVGRG